MPGKLQEEAFSATSKAIGEDLRSDPEFVVALEPLIDTATLAAILNDAWLKTAEAAKRWALAALAWTR